MRAPTIHIRTPERGSEDTPLCNKQEGKNPLKLTWIWQESTCVSCKSRLRNHPQLLNNLTSFRQMRIEGT